MKKQLLKIKLNGTFLWKHGIVGGEVIYKENQ